MFDSSRSAAPCLPWLAALALICTTAALDADPARAQVAKDLDCRKCVDSDAIAKKAVTKSKIEKNSISENRIKDGAVSEAKLSTDLRDHVAERESFYITLDGDGAEATIASHGPLRFFARCLHSQEPSPGVFRDRIEIVATSSADGWFRGGEENDEGLKPLAAGDEVIEESFSASPPGNERFDEVRDFSAVAPDGSYLAIEGESSGFGVNLFGHDCLVVGFIYRLTGAL